MMVALQNIHNIFKMFYWKLITQARGTAADSWRYQVQCLAGTATIWVEVSCILLTASREIQVGP